MTTTYPNTPGHKERNGASQEAAETAAGRASALRTTAFCLLKDKPMTADECAKAMFESVLSVRPRFSELVKTGKIEKSGERRRNASGCSAAVWRVRTEQRQQEMAL